MASKRPRARAAANPSPLADAERACAEARGDDAAFAAALAEYANRLTEAEQPLGELLTLAARGAPDEALRALREASIAALHEKIPTAAALGAMPGLDASSCANVPIMDDRMEAPFELQWRGGLVHEATFEIYDQGSPLGPVSADAYDTFLKLPACRLVRRLSLGNVACRDFENSSLLGDPVALLAREGIPPYLERLTLKRFGPISNSGDMGYLPMTRFTSFLMKKLDQLPELELGGCDDLRKLSLPKLRVLRLLDNVTQKTFSDLARADLPALERLSFESRNTQPPEERYHAVHAFLRTEELPALKHLELLYLDLDDDMRENVQPGDDDDDDWEPPTDPGSWVDMIADSPLLKRLSGLTLFFNDNAREHARFVERAADFGHLSHLEISGVFGTVTLSHPTRESMVVALEG